MYVVAANSAFDICVWNITTSTPDVARRAVRIRRTLHLALLPELRVVRQMLALATQSVVFSAILWILVAGPGFLTARDSLIPSGTVQTARQASR